MVELIIILYLGVAAFFLRRHMKLPWLLNPGVWFVLMQVRMTIGSLYFIDTSAYTEDSVYLISCLLLLIFFAMGTELKRARIKDYIDWVWNWNRQDTTFLKNGITRAVLLTLLSISVLATIAYYYIVGYNVFLIGLTTFVSEMRAEAGLEELRIQAYSTGDYYAPGYFNQFKNTLLPILTTYFLLSAKYQKKSYIYILSVIFIPINLVALFGTGQRGPFLYAAMAAIIAYSIVQGKKDYVLVVLLFAVILLFMLASLFLGRTTSELTGWSDVGLLLNEFIERLFKANQEGGVIGFRYIYNLPSAFGMEMYNELKGILPGREDSEQYIAHKIHEIMFGSTRGTAPLSLNGDLWVNFNILGVTVVAFFLGYIYQDMYVRLVKGAKNIFRIVCFSFMTVSLGFWSAGGIRAFFDDGLVTTLILYGIWLFISKTASKDLGKSSLPTYEVYSLSQNSRGNPLGQATK